LHFTHDGRWNPGTDPDAAKYKECAVRTSRFRFVNNAQLFDIAQDPAEKADVSANHQEEVARLRAAYDAWWADVRPCMENENPQNVPAQNPFKTAYWQQFGL
jgi:arylsulfatase